MARRRPDLPPGLLGRVRWGNVGRLAALVAAGLLILFGPRACSGSGPAEAEIVPPQQVPEEPSLRGPEPRAPRKGRSHRVPEANDRPERADPKPPPRGDVDPPRSDPPDTPPSPPPAVIPELIGPPAGSGGTPAPPASGQNADEFF